MPNSQDLQLIAKEVVSFTTDELTKHVAPITRGLGEQRAGLDLARAGLETLKREIRDTRSSIDRMGWRYEHDRAAERRMPTDLAGIVAKAITAMIRAGSHARPGTVERIVQELYANQPDVAKSLSDLPAVVKAAVNPASTTSAGWAAELITTQNAGGLLPSLAPRSAYAQLAPRGLRVSFAGFATLKLPAKSSGSLAGDFVAENAPIPIRQMALAAIDLSPKKMAVISAYSDEVAEWSTPSIEALVRQQMADDTAGLLDTRMLDSNAVSSARPPGLLNGVTPLTATTGGGVAALAGDLGALAAAIPNATDLVFVMNPGDRVRALALSPGLAAATIIESSTLTAKTVVALDAADFASGENDDPRFALSENAAIHMSDVPTALAIAGSPNTVSAPLRSFFQEDLIAIRLIVHVGWGMRRAGRIASIASVTW